VTPVILELEQSLAAPEEPMGIVISRGSREIVPPVFSAYVWGPPPNSEEEVRGAPRAA
jgi:hypothetical protein